MPRPTNVGMLDPCHVTGGVDRKPLVDIDNPEGIFWIATLPLGANCVFWKDYDLLLPLGLASGFQALISSIVWFRAVASVARNSFSNESENSREYKTKVKKRNTCYVFDPEADIFPWTVNPDSVWLPPQIWMTSKIPRLMKGIGRKSNRARISGSSLKSTFIPSSQG